MPIRAIESRRIFRLIADQVVALIDSGEFPRGARLPSERELAALLRVSRPSLREALIVLELGGKIEIRAGRGAFVVGSPVGGEMTEEENHLELLRPRWTIEGEIAMEAARNALPRDLEALRVAVVGMQHTSGDCRDADRFDHDFHLGIARATHNGALVSVAQNLWEQCRGALWKRTEHHFLRPRIIAKTLRDHRAVLSALDARDGGDARAVAGQQAVPGDRGRPGALFVMCVPPEVGMSPLEETSCSASISTAFLRGGIVERPEKRARSRRASDSTETLEDRSPKREPPHTHGMTTSGRRFGWAAEGTALGIAKQHLVGSSHDFVDAYVDSMPGEYLRLFDDAAIQAHAAIVQRRGSALTRVEAWKQVSEEAVAICVVADDVIGLFSRICAAMFAHGADVVAAQAYGRVRVDFVMEAVDLLWIRRAPGSNGSIAPLRPHDVVRIGETLDGLVRSNPSFQRTVRLVRTVRAAGSSTAVDFERDERGSTLLTVQADDRPGLLLAITRALFRERVQILSSHVETEGRRALDRFWVAELDGSALDSERQLALQAVVLEAIEGTTARLA